MSEKLTFYEYSQLQTDEQYDLVFRKGEFIEASEKDNVRFALYKLYGFYVEVVYDFVNNKIVSLTSFIQSNHP